MEKQESKQESNWLEEEEKSLTTPSENFEKLPSPQFEDGKITVLNIDYSKQFSKWLDEENKKTKAIIPCVSVIEGSLQRCNFWLNTKNPLYREVIKIGKDAKDKTNVEVKVIQIGSKEKTQYKVVKL